MRMLNSLPESAYDSVIDYLEQINENPKKWRFEQDLMSSSTDIQYWLDTKLKYEGIAEDFELIEKIGQDQKIINPIIIDTTNDIAIEGRHRMTAALKFNLPIPVICIFRA